MNVKKKYIIASLGIILLFAFGLVFYFTFSAGQGDGLESTMEEAGVEEDPFYEAPLDYGDDWFSAFVAGVIGFTLTFGLIYGYTRLDKDSG